LAVTASPTATPRAPRPTSTTVPTFSWPSTNGNDENGDVDGLALRVTTFRSLPQIPPIRVRTRTHRSPGSAGAATSP
jgi:hypothetical protein